MPAGGPAQAIAHMIGVGPTVVAGDFALSAGWGTTAAVSSVRGTDTMHTFTITASGTGQGASPTVTMTLKGAYAGTPNVLVLLTAGNGATVAVPPYFTTPSTTNYVFTYQATPGAGNTYIFTVFVMQ